MPMGVQQSTTLNNVSFLFKTEITRHDYGSLSNQCFVIHLR